MALLSVGVLRVVGKWMVERVDPWVSGRLSGRLREVNRAVLMSGPITDHRLDRSVRLNSLPLHVLARYDVFE